MLVWHCYSTTASEPTAGEYKVCCKNLDLFDRSCFTDRFQIVLNDLDVALFTGSAAELRPAQGCPLWGVKRTLDGMSGMSAHDPKRTSAMRLP